MPSRRPLEGIIVGAYPTGGTTEFRALLGALDKSQKPCKITLWRLIKV
tara:strand:+ start:1604 stop:1747 length:144 start_codon:yes stop_codon:yes gene_type:complete